MKLGTLGNVFRSAWYSLMAILIAGVAFTVAVWLPNVRLISAVIFSETASAFEKVHFLLSLYGSIGTNFTFVSASFTVIIALLFGTSTTLFIYYVRRVRGVVREVKSTSATSIGGLVSGMFGIGCAACGTFILTSLLSIIGASWLISYLPFGGVEFGFLGILLLLYSVYSLTNKIAEPMVCQS